MASQTPLPIVGVVRGWPVRLSYLLVSAFATKIKNHGSLAEL